MAEQPRGEQHRRGLLADMAVADDRVARRDAGRVEPRLEFGGRAQPQRVVGEFGERDAARSGDMAGAVGLPVRAAAYYDGVARCSRT